MCEYFIKNVLKIKHKNAYFTLNPKYGLLFRNYDNQFVESDDFRRQVAIYLNEFFKDGGKVTYFKVPDGIGNYETKRFKKQDLIKIKRMFVLMADSRVQPGYNISRYSFHKNSEMILGDVSQTLDKFDENVNNLELHSDLIERIFLHICQKNGGKSDKICFQNFLDFCYEIYNEDMSHNIRNRIAFDFYDSSRGLKNRPKKESGMNPSLIFTQNDLDTNNITYYDLETLILFNAHIIDPSVKDEIYTLCDYLYSKCLTISGYDDPARLRQISKKYPDQCISFEQFQDLINGDSAMLKVIYGNIFKDRESSYDQLISVNETKGKYVSCMVEVENDSDDSLSDVSPKAR